jgi:excisionase family DNA binding protein
MSENIEEQELLLRISAASRKLSVSESKLYRLIKKDEVPWMKIGGCLRIPVQALRTWIEENTAGTGGVL